MSVHDQIDVATQAHEHYQPQIDELIAENNRLAAELAVAQQTNREWLAANAPGGWIDNLRKGLTAETKGDASGG